MRKVAKVLFDIHDPSLEVINWVKTDVLVPLLYAPCICHKTPIADLNDVLIISLDNLLSLSLLLVVSELFPFVHARSRI